MSTLTPIRSERRLGVVFAAFAMLFILMLGRLTQLQFLDAAGWELKVASRRTRTEKIPAYRGEILDRHGAILAKTVTAYNLAFYPPKFRESNQVDALFDLLLVWCPELVPEDLRVFPKAFRDRVNERKRRFQFAYELREAGLRRLLGLKTKDLSFEKSELVARFGRFRHPHGELILPPSQLSRRLENALILIANNEVCSSRRALRIRLAEHETLGQALGASVARVKSGIEKEWESFRILADLVTPNDPELYFDKMFEAEQWNIRRVKRLVDRSLDDRICAVELGSHDLEDGIDKKTLKDLARELKVGEVENAEIERALVQLREQSGATEDDMNRLKAVNVILHGRSRLSLLQPYELESLARVLELWDNDPARVKRAFAQKIKDEPNFAERRGDYLSIEKEWDRTLQFKPGVPYTLFRGCGFSVAARVWNSFGLRDLGFAVSAAQSRSYWGDEEGIAAQIVGRCNSLGKPLGGLELALVQTKKTNGFLDAPLVGKAGQQKRYRELDGSWRVLEGGQEPIHGQDVQLTLDRDLQAEGETIAAELIRAVGGKKGAACCVIDVRTGEILVLASAPRAPGVNYINRYMKEANLRRELAAAKKSWKTNDTTLDEFRLTRNRIREELEHLAFFERSIAGGIVAQCPPGSVLKPIIAAALIEHNYFKADEIFSCPEKGQVDFRLAVERSSNPYFWEGARRMGREDLLNWYKRFGLMRPIPLLTNQSQSNARLNQVKNDAVKNIVIGQGSMSMSVLEVAAMMMNFARRGSCIDPHIVKRVGKDELESLEYDKIEVADWIYDDIFGAMRKVAQHYVPKGLAEKLDLAAKTGTAELGGRDKGLYNAWFAGFAPAHNPRYAFAVVAEKTPQMGKTTAPLAAKLIERVMQ